MGGLRALLSIVFIKTPSQSAVENSPFTIARSPASRILTKRIALLTTILAGVALTAYGFRASVPAGGKRTVVDALAEAAAPPAEPVRRVMDEAEYIGDYEAGRMNDFLSGMYDESGVDVRFIFARDIPGDLESYALQRARQLGVGRETDKRGLLFVYDVAGQRMRVEVGPGLEGIFTDGFVGFLTREQTAAFFAAGNRHLGLKSTLDVVNYRLREASLGGTYNPRAVAYIKNSIRLAEGAGANTRADAERGRDLRARRIEVASEDVRARFGPQRTVAAAHARYLEALHDGYFQPDLPLYTTGTQAVLRNFPTAAPFAQFIVLSEYGQQFTVVEHGDVAILFFTTTPLVSAHLFRRSSAGWQLDIAAEIRDTREFVASAYTWTMVPSGDDYSLAFAHLFADYGAIRLAAVVGGRQTPTRFLRPARGDNRPLPTRVRHALPPPFAPASSVGSTSLLLPVVASDTENFGYPTQTINRLAVRRLLLARSFDALDTLLGAYADSVRRDYRLEYRLFDAYAAFDVAVPSLEPLLTEWVEQRPTSAAAHLARATFFRASGWKVRGGKETGETSRQQFRGMEDFFRRASADLAAAVRLEPNSLVAYRQLMDIATTQVEREACRQLLDRALKIQPYSFLLRATYMHSLLPRWGGSHDAMAKFAQESAPYADRNPRIRALRGFVDWDLGDKLEDAGHKAQAAVAFKRALGFGDFWQFRFQRGALYARSDQNKEALADLNRVLAQYPQHSDALYWRSLVEYDLGRESSDEASGAYYSHAYTDIQLAVALDPTDEYYRRQLAFVRKYLPEFEPPAGP
ncbi:MAG TPA: TPM domain-containing protein [Gemmatimonadaceae bacterium]